jgi:hypothetical protein
VDRDGAVVIALKPSSLASREDMRRAVSCVNSCVGIDTDKLDAGAVREMVFALRRIAARKCRCGIAGPCGCGDADRQDAEDALDMVGLLVRA